MKNKKKVLLVSQYFYPENFKGNDIAFDLVEKGFDVTVVCGIPNYPHGKFIKGYNVFKRRREVINGVKIIRALQVPRGKNNKVKLMLNYLTFIFFSSIICFFLSLTKKIDLVFVQGLSPILQAIPGIIVKKLQKIPLYLWVLDLWPDAMKSGGGIQNSSILRAVEFFVRYIYKNTDKILISSKMFKESICLKGDFGSKIQYYPNWSDDFFLNPMELPNKDVKKIIPKGFIVMMAGNLGKAQDIPSVLQCATLLKKNTNIKWVFVGDGSMRKWGQDFVSKNELDQSVFFVGRHQMEQMKYFYSYADVMLLTLKSDFDHLKRVVPARLQSYMSAGKTIVGMIDGGASQLIEEANCGLTVPAGDFDKLASIILKISKEHTDYYSLNSRNYYLANFQRGKCIDELINMINIDLHD